MLTCFDSVRAFYIRSVIVQSYVRRAFRLSDIVNFEEQKLCDIRSIFVWVFANVVIAIICWQERHRDGMHSALVAFFLTFRSFWLSLIIFVPFICLNDVFLRKTMTGDFWYFLFGKFKVKFYGMMFLYLFHLCRI